MKYLVLYETESPLSHKHTGYDKNVEYITVEYASPDYTHSTWREFDNKKEAIEFARQNKGVIVEAFEWDIKKEAKK